MAAIAAGPVSVIARLTGRVQDPVAAAEADLVLAGGRAPVAVPGVSVVALLTGRHDSIATAGWRAVGIATVAVHEIAIVTLLAAARVEHAIPAHDPGLCLARRGATV